jgi:hypothetical protein
LAIFYIEARDHLIPFQPSQYTIMVRTPSGLFPTVTIAQDLDYPNRHICRFSGVEAGRHVISVCLGLGHQGYHHLDGSPAEMIISRNYDPTTTRAILMKLMTPVVVEDPASTELQVRVTSKIWGVTNNPQTEDVSQISLSHIQ